MEKSTKKRVRNVVLGMTSVALVAGITASLTLAYLTDTDSKTNVFTGTEGLTGLLLEPDFDGDIDGTRTFKENTNEKEIEPDTGVEEPKDNGGWGYEAAQDYMPGDTINKNPYVKNTSEQAAYVKLAVKYYIDGTESTYAEFSKFADLYYDADNKTSTNWKQKDNDSSMSAFYYKGTNSDGTLAEVAKDAQTDNLFKDVKIKSSLTLKTVDGATVLYDGENAVTKGNTTTNYSALPKLEIKLAAVLVGETDADTDFDAQTALDSVTITWETVTA